MGVSKFSKITGLLLLSGLFVSAFADINISVNAKQDIKKISPYLFGRNIGTIDEKTDTLSQTELTFMNQIVEAGLHMIRANQGNNATRYNFRKKFSVHPNWFNNVNIQNWDISAKKILENMPGVDAMYAFQMSGYVAKTQEYNFDDWNYYITHNNTWPANKDLNLAGGGLIADDGKSAIKEGDPTLYNQEWPLDSSVAIIPYWRDSLKFDMNRLRYWSMDNEVEIWRYTHDDLNLPVTADFLVERYIDLAKKARAQWKDIKLTGPVTAGEWDWCVIRDIEEDEHLINRDGKKYCWLEYFIKRISEAQKTSGIRLLDMFDIHWYPTEKDYESRMNWHRVLFDTTYNYPGANGIKFINGYWDDNQTKEYIFKRINDWLTQYFGKDHGVTLGMSETSLKDDDAMVTALIYASFLGTMIDNGVEFFTPWTWDPGMYEVAHLFSRYGKSFRIESISTNDSLVSAYSSINATGDSLTVILVNRSQNESQKINLSVKDFNAIIETAKTLSLTGLTGETFVSHSENALKNEKILVSSTGETSLTLPAKSITAILLESANPSIISSSSLAESSSSESSSNLAMLYFNKSSIKFENDSWVIYNPSELPLTVEIFDYLGNHILRKNVSEKNSHLNLDALKAGPYLVKFKSPHEQGFQRIFLK